MRESIYILESIKRNKYNIFYYIIFIFSLYISKYIVITYVLISILSFLKLMYNIIYTKGYDIYPTISVIDNFIYKILLNLSAKKTIITKIFILIELMYRYLIIFFISISLKSIFISCLFADFWVNNIHFFNRYNKINFFIQEFIKNEFYADRQHLIKEIIVFNLKFTIHNI
jgi:hypothetical protein